MGSTNSVKSSCDLEELFDDEIDVEIFIRGRVVQYPEGRTYGECIEDEKRSIRMINGRFVPTIRILDKPFRLSRSEALVYYTKKLQKVWEAIPPQ